MITSLTEYAGFWRRSMAILLDMFWIIPLLELLLYFADSPFSSDWYMFFLITEILPALLILWFWIRYAATPGKLLFDCEIVDAYSGDTINFKQALLRYLGYLVSLLPLGLGFLWILWDKRKQGWHDKIAGTVVIIHDEATVPLHKLL